MLKKIPRHIKFFSKIFLLELFILFLFRIVFFIAFKSKLGASAETFDIFKAFILGFQFDTVVISYFIIIPFLLNSLIYTLNLNEKLLTEFNRFYIFATGSFLFIASSADLSYFRQFFTRVNSAIFAWNDSPLFAVKIFFEDIYLLMALFPILIVLPILWIALKKLTEYHYGTESNYQTSPSFKVKVVISAIFIILLALGTRGRLSSKSPIRVGTAYFSNDSFVNQLGLNPAFTLIKSLQIDYRNKNKAIEFMDNKVAVTNVQKYLNIQTPYNPKFPLSRLQKPLNTSKNKNIILIIMESMSAAKSAAHGGAQNLTPNLDELKSKSLSFNNAFTMGIHTYNGIYSTLMSLPPTMNIHPMKTNKLTGYSGIANTLKDNNYETIYFTTHDGQFDNAAGFLSANGYDKVISQKDYPSEKILSTLGVADHYMYEFSQSYIEEIYKKNKPFFIAMMSASDHGPRMIPEDVAFKPTTTDIMTQSVEYADWAIKHLIDINRDKPWFKDTVFVFFADHGSNWNPTYDMPLTYHRSPFIIYDPSEESPNEINSLALQVDVFPTLMSYLGIEFVNNTVGIDLLQENRPYAYFSADDKIGVISDEFFYVTRNNGVRSLYRYKDRDTTNMLNVNEELAGQMDTFAKSFIQATQVLLKENLVDHIKKGTP